MLGGKGGWDWGAGQREGDVPSSPMEPWSFQSRWKCLAHLAQAATPLPQPPLALGLWGPRPALPNLLSTRFQASLPAQTERVCASLAGREQGGYRQGWKRGQEPGKRLKG